MSNIGEQIRRIAERKKIALEAVVRKTVFEMATDMVQMSPVDTGMFANSWMTSVGSINRDASADPDKAGTGSMERIGAAVASWKMGETMYFTNSLPYAYRLETGWSKQAPAGMVGVTMVNFQTHFDRALSEAKP